MNETGSKWVRCPHCGKKYLGDDLVTDMIQIGSCEHPECERCEKEFTIRCLGWDTQWVVGLPKEA